MKKRLLSLALIALSAMQLIACSNSPDAAVDNGGDTLAGTDSAETDAVTEITPDLPDIRFDDADFNILTCGNWGNDWTEIYDFTADEITGEPINDAVHNRNSIVEEKYGVTITEINKMGNSVGGTGKGADFIKKSQIAGDNAYDAGLIGAYDVSTLAYNGYMLDLMKDVPYLDLEKPWWDQKANSDLMMKGKMYYSTGDISTLDNDCTFCILFNKELIDIYNMQNPYAMVRDGSWTIDNFIGMASMVSGDINGDGKYDKDDLYGFCIWQDSMMGMINACGEKFCSINADGEIELTLNTERGYNMITKYMELAYNKQLTYSIYHQSDTIEAMFSNDQVLFYTRYLCIIKKYRDMETDFGILPYPKYDETQKDYYATVAPYGCSFIGVPLVVSNVEMTGVILEALAYESVDSVTPAYYDITLNGKLVRDDESSEMLDIILGNRVFDLGLFYQVGGYNEEIMNLFRNYKTDFISMCDKFEAKATSTLQTINEAFAQVNS